MKKFDHLREAICDLVSIAEDSVDGELFKELDEAGASAIDCLDELEGYKNAEDQGLLPRFHLGDEFWTVGYSKVSKSKVVMLQQKKDGTWKYRFCNEYSNTMDCEERELGKYFFATKEEAEQALAEMRNIEEAKDNLATEIARIGYTDKADARERIEQALK